MEQLPLRKRNKQRIRERILAAALDLFRANGYTQTTMDEIAEKAEVSRGTLFNYFPTKDELLWPFINDIYVTRVRPALDIYLTEHPTTLQALRFLFLNIYEQVVQVPDIVEVFKQEFTRPRIPQPSEQRRPREVYQMILTVVRYGQTKGDVRNDLQPEMLARFISMLHISTLFNTIMAGDNEAANYADQMDEMLKFVASGLTDQA